MNETAPWEYEWFYYGNANWPSDSTWRKRGDEYQALVELGHVNGLEDAKVLWSYYDDRGWLEPFHRRFKGTDLEFLDAWVVSDQATYIASRRGAWANPDGSFPLNQEREVWTPLEA